MGAIHNRIRRVSIKESFDNLPSGICFANRTGIIVLCNRQMHRFCRTLMGRDLQYLAELREALLKPQKSVTVLRAAPAVYLFPDGTVWQTAECTVTDESGSAYTQMQAMNVTDLYAKKAELEQENNLLAEANARAKALYAQLDQLVRERETLAMKVKVHDELGLALIASGKLLGQEKASLSDLRSAGRLWAEIACNLGIAEPSSPEGKPAADRALSDLLAAAAGIGVKIILNGELPQDDGVAYLFTVAMRECATNLVYHAGGDTLSVTLRETAHFREAVIENNGEAPDGPIREGGGLGSLRRQIEAAGGNMRIESSPVFRLKLSFPRKAGEK
jgi:hypothetical protein